MYHRAPPPTVRLSNRSTPPTASTSTTSRPSTPTARNGPGWSWPKTMWYPSDEQLRPPDYGHDNLRVFGSVGVGTLKGWGQPGRGRWSTSPISDAARPAGTGQRPRPHDRRDAGRRVEMRRPRDRHDFALHPLRRTQRRAGREPHRGRFRGARFHDGRDEDGRTGFAGRTASSSLSGRITPRTTP